MARVTWSPAALRQLALIRAYIDQFDPNAAQRLAGRLLAAGESLREFPNRGRPTSDGKRELPTVAPYVIRYVVRGDGVRILRVKHGRQRR
jgi:plasmid stabilization system protein ParE